MRTLCLVLWLSAYAGGQLKASSEIQPYRPGFYYCDEMRQCHFTGDAEPIPDVNSSQLEWDAMGQRVADGRPWCGHPHLIVGEICQGSIWDGGKWRVVSEPALPKPEAIDIPAIQEDGIEPWPVLTSSTACFGMEKWLQPGKMHWDADKGECSRWVSNVWTCADKTRILEHDEHVPPHFYCRKPQTEAFVNEETP